jgi:hypothetical protein
VERDQDAPVRRVLAGVSGVDAKLRERSCAMICDAFIPDRLIESTKRLIARGFAQ